jgi:L-amino acid N-acyltransferase YncA
MEIRHAHPEDLHSVNLIYNQAVEERYSSAHLEPVDLEYTREWFTGHPAESCPVFVACEKEQVLGWISLSPYRKGRQALEHVREVSYYVHNGHRGKGIGQGMMEHVIHTAPALGISVLVAILLAKNPASRAMLQKFGFAQWGNLPGIARIGTEELDHLYFGLKL